MEQIIKELADTILGGTEFLNTVQVLNCILDMGNPKWLIENGNRIKTIRFEKGQLINVYVSKTFTAITPDGEKNYIDGEILNVTETDPANYRILATLGASTHSFSLKLEQLSTSDHYYLKLPEC